MNDKLLYTTKELFDSYLKGKKYAIPPYQRGYKWESKDIERLLKDINDFCPDEELGLFYCLQNITLVEKEESFNVVDGQQRLTTLIVLLSYMGEYELIKDKLLYNVRSETEDFLKEFIFKPSNLGNFSTWEQFLGESVSNGKDHDYQDIYYLFNAFKTIKKWFDERPQNVTAMKDKILNHLKVIVNLPKNIDEQELFENLNGKRVPLDGADLIRALIITRVAKKEIGEQEDSTKKSVLINERRVKIGMLLDSINLWWNDQNKLFYFRHFVKDVKVSDSISVAFDDKSYPINNLYKLYALKYNSGVLSMELFEQKSVESGFLQELQTLQRTIENWYYDRELYHLILFTILYASDGNKEKELKNLGIIDLFNLWEKNHRRAFIKELKVRISKTDIFEDLIKQCGRNEKENENTALQESWYDKRVIPVSVLLDIICILASNNDTKLPALYFNTYEEDLEHIFPQTPIGDKIKDKGKQTQILNKYLEIINGLIPQEEKIIIADEEIDWDNSEWKENIKSTINSKTKSLIPINSLGNMCVLNRSVNRGYGNDFFLEKRIDIMRKTQEGVFIRPHIYDAFNKIFLNRQDECINMSMMVKWDKSDILSRRIYIINQISKFLDTNEQA